MVSNQFLDIQLIRDIHLIPLRVSYKKLKQKQKGKIPNRNLLAVKLHLLFAFAVLYIILPSVTSVELEEVNLRMPTLKTF